MSEHKRMKEDILIKLERPSILQEYGKVPISFQVTSEYRVRMRSQGLGGVDIGEVPVSPYDVDYDREHEKGPERWLERWDLSNWVVFSAFQQNERIGGAVVAFDTSGVNMLDGRKDVAVLWDIRIRPDYRINGIGTSLIQECIKWAQEKNCKYLKIETQNYNVSACKFYAKQGAVLGNIEQLVYEENPNNYRFIWWITL